MNQFLFEVHFPVAYICQKKSDGEILLRETLSLSNNRIVLIGFRGSGKTTIAKEISRQLGWKYISTDDLIEEGIQTTISDFVNREGWPSFRQRETAVIKKLQVVSEAVIDCGGGVVEDPQNMAYLEKNALIVWVDAALSDIVMRLQNDSNRPLLNQPDLVQDIEYNYRRREPLYRRYSHLYVNTSEENLIVICRKIRGKLSS